MPRYTCIYGSGVLQLLLCLLLTPGASAAWNTSDAQEVRRTILSSSHPYVRPSRRTTVNVSLSLLTINELDVKTQRFSTTGWLTTKWMDDRLRWSEAKYPDVAHVYCPSSEIWTPQLFIVNSQQEVSILEDEHVLLSVRRDGLVEWKLPRIFSTFCVVDVTYYPFDTQKCVIEVSSWVYTIQELVLLPAKSSANYEDIRPHGEWSLISSSVFTEELHEIREDGVVEIYSQLDIFVKMERKSSYYVTSVLLPIVLTSFLSLFVFLLPVESGEKVGFILTVLLALEVLLTLVSDQVPSTSINTSVLSVHLAFMICFGVVCCLLTVMVLIIYERDPAIPISSQWKWLYRKVLVPSSCWKLCSSQANKRKINVKSTPSNRQVGTLSDGDTDIIEGKGASNDISWRDIGAVLDHFFLVSMGTLITVFTTGSLVALTTGTSDFQGHVHH